MALNKAAQAEANDIVSELIIASTWSTGNKGAKLQQLAKRVANLANLEDPLPDVPAVPVPGDAAAPTQ